MIFWNRADFGQKCTLFISFSNNELACVLFLEIYYSILSNMFSTTKHLQEKLNSQLYRPGSHLTKIVDMDPPPPPSQGRNFDSKVEQNYDSINPHDGLYVNLNILIILFSSWFFIKEISYMLRKQNGCSCLLKIQKRRRYMYHKYLRKEFGYGVYSSRNYLCLNVHIKLILTVK